MERLEGFETYTFTTAASRAGFRLGLTEELTGVEFEMRETDETVAHFPLFFLHLRRISLTFKQLLTEGAH